MNTTCKSSLRILQWNAEGLSTKLYELSARLKEDDIDVCLIQESHLQEKSPMPFIEGYKVIRADRVATIRGGLVAYVRKTLVVEELGKVAIDATEVSSFRIQLKKKKWIHISNVYVPPAGSKGQDIIQLRTHVIPSLKSALICGDFNAHTLMWDNRAAPDKRGEELLDWAFDHELTILNNGDGTRVDRSSGRLSAPDVTLCGPEWNGKTEWSIAEPIGSSDHLPIIITVSSDVKHQAIFGKKSRWRSKGVNWEEFRNEIEDNLDGIEELNHMSRIMKLNSVILDSAKKHVRKVKPGKRTKIFMTPTVRAAIRKRNQLRGSIKEWKKE